MMLEASKYSARRLHDGGMVEIRALTLEDELVC